MEILKSTILFLFFSIFGLSFAQSPSVIITELMPDPSPQVFLPNAEYIEIYNRTAQEINLKGWTISDPTSKKTFGDVTILPKEYITLCHDKHYTELSKLGKTISFSSFITLNNNSDSISLKDNKNNIVHSITYTTNWYHNTEKQSGGWSLEMIDPNNYCLGIENWAASIGNLGGTPSKQNSIRGTLQKPPFTIINQYSSDNKTTHLLFNQKIISTDVLLPKNFSLDTLILNQHTQDRVTIKTNEPLEVNNLVTFQLKNIQNCIYTDTKLSFEIGLSDSLSAHDFILNEVLFNPSSEGTDFIEIKNVSNKLLNLNDLHLGNVNSSNLIETIYHINTHKLIKPNDILVLTKDKNTLIQYHQPKYPQNIIETSLPSLPDNEGNIVLLNNSGQQIDILHYSEDWHFSLLKDKEGVSLEKINSRNFENNKHNWFSASSQANYATPTEENSQRNSSNATGDISLAHTSISPDGNGENDLLILQYSYIQSGLLLNSKIFNRTGVLVKQLINNESLNNQGQVTWDGQTDNNTKAPVGIYILVWQITDSNGQTKITKKTFSIGAKL